MSKLTGRPKEQADFTAGLLEKIRTAAKKKSDQAEQNAFILKFCADVLTFLACLQTKPDDQAEYYRWDSGTLLHEFWPEILKFKQYDTEPAYLLLLLKEALKDDIAKLVVDPYKNEAKQHYHLIGATECTFPSTAPLLKQVSSSYLPFSATRSFSETTIDGICQKIHGFQELISGPTTGQAPDTTRWFCALAFAVGDGVILVMVPWKKNPEAPELRRPFTVLTKGKVYHQSIRRILEQLAAGLSAV